MKYKNNLNENFIVNENDVIINGNCINIVNNSISINTARLDNDSWIVSSRLTLSKSGYGSPLTINDKDYFKIEYEAIENEIMKILERLDKYKDDKLAEKTLKKLKEYFVENYNNPQLTFF